MTKTALDKKNAVNLKADSPLSKIWEAANIYGARSFDNYVQIRSLAETLRDLLCEWLHGGDETCVYLVPPEGAFQAQNYQSGAFSVSGTGYLPLKPISFGLAVRISEDKDYMRLQMHCQKEGDLMKVSIGQESPVALSLPLDETQMTPLFDLVNDHILGFFRDSVAKYDEGDYGTSVIGFDISRVDE